MKTTISILLLWVLLVHSSVFAEPELLEQWLQTAQQNNRELVIQEYNEQIAKLEINLNNILPDPVYMTEFKGMPMDPIDPGKTSEWMFMLQQTFPFPGKLKQSEHIAEINSKNQNLQTRATDIKLRSVISSLYYKKLYLQQALEINKQIENILGTIITIAKSKYETGQISLYNINRTKIEQEKIKNQLIVLNQMLESVDLTINQVLGNPLDKKLPEIKNSKDMLLELPETIRLDSLIYIHNPFINIAKNNIDTGKFELKFNKLTKYPDITVMGGYMAMNNMPDRLMGRISISLPFMPWSNKDNKAKIEQAKIRINRNELAYTELNEKISSESESLVKELNSIKYQWNSYNQSILVLSQQNLDLSLSEFETSNTDFTDLLETINDNLKHQLYKAKLSYDYFSKLAQLEQLVGTKLTK